MGCASCGDKIMTDAVLGIIGGSGIYDLPGLENVREETIESPWGEPSAAVRRGTIAPPPPMPLFQGSRTPSAKEVATTASTQSPPAANTSAPISAALRDCATTMPPRETAAGLRNCWALLN